MKVALCLSAVLGLAFSATVHAATKIDLKRDRITLHHCVAILDDPNKPNLESLVLRKSGVDREKLISELHQRAIYARTTEGYSNSKDRIYCEIERYEAAR